MSSLQYQGLESGFGKVGAAGKAIVASADN